MFFLSLHNILCNLINPNAHLVVYKCPHPCSPLFASPPAIPSLAFASGVFLLNIQLVLFLSRPSFNLSFFPYADPLAFDGKRQFVLIWYNDG